MLIIGQYRYPTLSYCWELPGGGVDADATPLQAAQAELQEEAGMQAAERKLLGELQAFGGVSDVSYSVFIARGLTRTLENSQEEEGITQMKAVPFSEVLRMVRSGEFSDGQSISALLLAALDLGLLA